MKFGENLKALRKKSKMSQDELAEKVMVSRQSVSKWENGESYPEMNNILQLCKIFRCDINDLINDAIIDINSLDEEVKMSVVKLKKEQQRKMKGLSKAIAIIAKVGKILVYVSIPAVVASMIILGVLITKVEVNNNEISLKGMNELVTLISNDEELTIKYNDTVVAKEKDKTAILKIKEVLDNNTKTEVFIYLESGFLFLVIMLVTLSVILKHVEKLFENIYDGDTPFTLENVEHIKKTAYLMIAMIILPSLVGVMFEFFMKTDLNVDFELFSLIEILFLFSLAYIFEYGYQIQKDSKGKMYGEENE